MERQEMALIDLSERGPERRAYEQEGEDDDLASEEEQDQQYAWKERPRQGGRRRKMVAERRDWMERSGGKR